MAKRHPCPNCAKEMFLEKVHEGFDVPCPACGHTFHVARGTVEDPPPAPYPPPVASGGGGSRDEATVPLIIGIIGVSLCNLISPVAWVMGHRLREQARRERREPSGTATAAWVLGIVGTILLCLSACLVTVYIAAIASFGLR